MSRVLMASHSVKGRNVFKFQLYLFELGSAFEIVNDFKNINIDEVRMTSINSDRRVVRQVAQGLNDVSFIQEGYVFGKAYCYFLLIIFFFLREVMTSSVIVS